MKYNREIWQVTLGFSAGVTLKKGNTIKATPKMSGGLIENIYVYICTQKVTMTQDVY